MQASIKNATGANNSSPASRLTPVTGIPGRNRAKSSLHYYNVSLRANGTWSTDLRAGLYISRIIRAISKEEAIGFLCAWVKSKFPQHSILAKEISCENFSLRSKTTKTAQIW
jgi:hypothetical protein